MTSWKDFRLTVSKFSEREALSTLQSKSSKDSSDFQLFVVCFLVATHLTDLAEELSCIITALGKKSQWQQALSLLFDGGPVNVVVLNCALTACKLAHQWPIALRLVTEISWKGVVPDIISYNSIVAGVASEGHWDVALMVLSLAQQSQLELDQRSYTNVLQACAPGHWDVCLSILQNMLEDVVDIDAFVCAAAVSSCAESKNWQLALHLLQSVSRCWHAEKRVVDSRGNWQVPIATAMNICGSAGQWTVAVSLLERMQSLSAIPNIVTFGTAMQCLEQNCSWLEVIQLFSWMHTLRMSPNVYTYSMLMSSLEKGGMWRQVFDTFAEMKDSKILPTSVSYDVLVRSCQDWQVASHVLDSMRKEQVHPTVRTLNACLSVLEADSLWSVSIQMLQKMGSMALRPDVASFSIVASTCAKGGAWQMSLRVLDEICSLLLQVDAISLGASILACEKGSQWHAALVTLQEMKDLEVQINEVSVSSVVRACQSRGCWENALNVLSTAFSWSVPVSSGAYNPALAACCSSRSWERALSLFATAMRSNFRPDEVSLTTLMSACEVGFQWEYALGILFSFSDFDVQMDATACNVAISSCSSLQKWRMALALLQCDLLKTSLPQDAWPDLIAYNTLLGSCAQPESWQVAILIFQELCFATSTLQPDTTTFHAILEAMAVGHAWESSLQILEEVVQRSFPCGIARNLVAAGCQAANQLMKAGELLIQNLNGVDGADIVTFKTLLDISEKGHFFVNFKAPSCLEALASCARGNLAMERYDPVDPGGMVPAAQAVVAAEMLHWHQSLYEELSQQLLRHLGKPSMHEMWKLCRSKPKDSGHGRLQNEILERQFGLSPAISQKLLMELFDRPGCWCSTSAISSRRVLHGMVSLDEEPTSKDLAAWASWSLSSPAGSFSFSSRCQGYGGHVAPGVILPVQVQHDRSPHAERQVLLGILRTWAEQKGCGTATLPA